MADVNYDEIRVGNKLRFQAEEETDYELDNYRPAERERHRKRIFNEKLESLVKAHNKAAINQIPLSSVQVTVGNQDLEVIRYTLLDGVSIEEAEAVVDEWDSAKIDPAFDITEESLNGILGKAFVIHTTTMKEAAENDSLKRFPRDCLVVDDNLPEIEPEHDSDVDKIVNNIEKNIEPTQDPFELKDISAEQLNAGLHKHNMGHVHLSKVLELHHKTVEKWTRDGVPSEHKMAVYQALA